MRRRAAVLLLLPLLAHAKGDPYAMALAKGRALEDKGKHAEALKAFDEALKLKPDDPATLSEVSVAALANGDLPRARDAAQRAAAGAPQTPLAAASLFNLGRVEEAAHDKAKAIEAYERSLKAWQNPTVRARLFELDRAAAEELEPYAPETLDGPFATLGEWPPCPGRLGVAIDAVVGGVSGCSMLCW